MGAKKAVGRERACSNRREFDNHITSTLAKTEKDSKASFLSLGWKQILKMKLNDNMI